MPDLAEVLSKTSPFSEFTSSDLKKVATLARRIRYRKGDIVTLYGESWPYLFLVEEGLFQAVKESNEGRSLILLSLHQGEVFWGLTFFDPKVPMPVTLRAEADGALAVWKDEEIKPYLEMYGEAIWALCRLLVGRMQRASILVEDLAFQPIAGRLARLLLEQYGDSLQIPVMRDLTLDEMAARVGTTREMICRVLYQLSDAGLIQITRTEFTLIAVEELAALASSNR